MNERSSITRVYKGKKNVTLTLDREVAEKARELGSSLDAVKTP